MLARILDFYELNSLIYGLNSKCVHINILTTVFQSYIVFTYMNIIHNDMNIQSFLMLTSNKLNGTCINPRSYRVYYNVFVDNNKGITWNSWVERGDWSPPIPQPSHPLKLDIAVVSSQLLNRPTCFCSSIGFMSELGNTLLQGTIGLSLLIHYWLRFAPILFFLCIVQLNSIRGKI